MLEQLDFASLEEAGYLYELWSVSPQDGSKDVIAASGGSHDFSHAAKSTFNMPTQWTLSIMPEQGWIPREWSIFLAVGVIVVEALIFGLAFALGSPFDVRVGFMPKPCVATTRRGCSPIARSSTSSNAPPP